MQNRYTQIQFMAANYSRLQGLKEVPVGLLVSSISLWAINNRGPNADLTIPLILTVAAILTYWLIRRFYNNTYGRIQQTLKLRRWETIASILFSLLALFAFWIDTAYDLPVSLVGLVFSGALFEDFWRATSVLRERSFQFYPENLVASILILALSLFPLSGVEWWKTLGIPSQVTGVLLVIGILIALAGIWGHVRILHLLPARETESNDDTL